MECNLLAALHAWSLDCSGSGERAIGNFIDSAGAYCSVFLFLHL
jgi:hypothetical protein